jgi:hypothetical protein
LGPSLAGHLTTPQLQLLLLLLAELLTGLRQVAAAVVEPPLLLPVSATAAFPAVAAAFLAAGCAADVSAAQ